MTVKIKFEPRDLWVGVYWKLEPLNSQNYHDDYTDLLMVYLCILPTLPIIFTFEL